MYKIHLQEYTWSDNYTDRQKSNKIIDCFELGEIGDHINPTTNKPYKYCVVHGHVTEFFDDIQNACLATTPSIGNFDYGMGCYQLDGYIYKRM